MAKLAEPELLCTRCRRMMHEQKAEPTSRSNVCPFIQRLRGYQQVAKESQVAFTLTDTEAVAIMRRDCSMCGMQPPQGKGNGITRLGLTTQRNMGPYAAENTAPACTMCNMGKGCHSKEAYIEICRHISTHRGFGGFGHFPHRFRDNISKRSRSSYIAEKKTKSQCIGKTHALTNEQFNAIVARPCWYCGKESDPPKHYNGLDRLDSAVRVYSEDTCVSCCGTCNVSKYRYSVDDFLNHCVAVATHNCSENAS